VGVDTGFSAIGALAFVNGALYGFDNVGKNVLKIEITTGLATVLFPFPTALAADKVDGAADVVMGQRLPGRFLAGAPGGQIIDFNLDASNGFNLAPYDSFPAAVQQPSGSSYPSVALNGTIAFASTRANTGSRIYVMNADASNIRQITFPDATGADDLYPSISPDATKVAFISRRAISSKQGFFKIFVVNADGTGLRQVDPFTTDSNGNIQDQDLAVAWSPDSTRLVFRGVRFSTICNPKGAPGFVNTIGMINVDGSGEKDLACDNGDGYVSALDWSPDGTLIVWNRNIHHCAQGNSGCVGEPAIVFLDLSGQNRYASGITSSALGADSCQGGAHCIHFSPDNKRLAFEISPGYQTGSSTFTGIGIINLDGSGLTLSANPNYAPDNFWWAPALAIPAPAKMTLAPDPVQVWPGHTQQLTASLLDASGNVITHAVQGYPSEGGYCEMIDAAGLVSVSPGSVNNVSSVAAANAGLTSNTVVVDCLAQQPPCTYTLSSTSQYEPSSGGSGSVTVSTQGGCAWTAVSNVCWITIASSASGTANGTVNYVVAANTGLQRSGTVSIAGQTFTVTEGAPAATVNTGGIVNNASYTLASGSVAPGSIAAVFGSNLTDGTSCVPASGCNPAFDSNGLLGTTMANAQVTVNGVAVPMFYASPSQLGIQIPAELTGTSATLQVQVNGQPGPPQAIPLDAVAPGIFAQTQDGKGAGAITHVDGSAVTPQNPAKPGELVILYATGLGAVTQPVPTGALATSPTTLAAAATVMIDGAPVTPDFAGLSGCCVGLNQVNVRLPASLRSAANVPIILSVAGKQSNTVTIAVSGP
jgi:uncharacterized protein (TIGR03437 family)